MVSYYLRGVQQVRAQACEIRFQQRIKGLTLFDTVRSSKNQNFLNNEPLFSNSISAWIL